MPNEILCPHPEHSGFFKPATDCPDCDALRVQLAGEHGRPGIDVPNYGALAVGAMGRGEPLPPLSSARLPRAEDMLAPPTGANARQPGGDHYRRRDYQHWDFVVDTGMHYLLGCATKYVSRWQQKNGVQDLEKAIHYLDKATECDILPPPYSTIAENVRLFATQLEPNDGAVVVQIMQGNYEAAATTLRWMANHDTA
jgi:hypothetical protein